MNTEDSSLLRDVGKRLPYHEGEEYLDNLLEQVAATAVRHRSQARARRHWALMITSAAAVVLLVLGIGLSVLNSNEKIMVTASPSSSPMDEFLNSLTDEEVAQLPYYEIEEIPEY